MLPTIVNVVYLCLLGSTTLTLAEYSKGDHIGCFADQESPRHLDGPGKLFQYYQIETCISFCEAEHYNFAGAEIVWCYCGNVYDTTAVADETLCNVPCYDNSDQYCGGVSVLSIYATGINVLPCSSEQSKCADFARCVNIERRGFRCECITETNGDGLAGEDHTGCNFDAFPCTLSDNDCMPDFGICVDDVCKCKAGFVGDGHFVCEDIDECVLIEPCNIHADCQNNPGSFECTCWTGYTGNGLNCQRICRVKEECHPMANCVDNVCMCPSGFTGDGFLICTDIDECAVNHLSICPLFSACKNEEGSYICICMSGFYMDVKTKTCVAYVRNCNDHLKMFPGSKSNTYYVDPDGPGAMPVIAVECIMNPNFGITMILTKTNKIRARRGSRSYPIKYIYDYDIVEKIIDTSGFCYQFVEHYCGTNEAWMDGNDWWIDRHGNHRTNWGGAKENNTCACGQIKRCKNPNSPCHCNGEEKKMMDSGKIFDKDILPVKEVHIGDGRKATVFIKQIMCGPAPFDIPKDCHEARFFYKIRYNGPQVIDVDGPQGLLEPFLADCDMNSFPHVGVTIIPHNRPTAILISENGKYDIKYEVDDNQMMGLIEISEFCMQELDYKCTNSPLFPNGEVAASFSGVDGVEHTYWGGAMGESKSCGCGLSGTCDFPDVKCNCDIMDGQERYDFGYIIDKAHLPVSLLTFYDAEGINRTSSVNVSSLFCSQHIFGLHADCEKYRFYGAQRSYTYLIDPDKHRKRGVNPFPVQCLMSTDPPVGITIVHHHHNEKLTFSQMMGHTWVFRYRYANYRQLKALTKRSTFCQQTIKYYCSHAPVHEATQRVYWYDASGNKKYYLDGTKGNACACYANKSCSGGPTNLCNCDMAASYNGVDEGVLLQKDDLPLTKFHVGMSQHPRHVEVGHLECHETYPTCKEQYDNQYSNRGNEKMIKTVYIAIDPDGAGPIKAFKVLCEEYKTVVSVEQSNSMTDDGKSKCFNIQYYNDITSEQLNALIEKSDYCLQQLAYTCTNFPLIDHVFYKNCRGEIIPGWAGSEGQPSCSCGVIGTCDGGPTAKCNCDSQDSKIHVDKGHIHHKSLLPVCEVCIALDPMENPNLGERKASYYVTDLECSPKKMGVYSSCQQRWDKRTSKNQIVMMSPVSDPPTPVFPVFCYFNVHPPVGYLEILPKQTIIDVPSNGEVIIEYFVFEMTYILSLVKQAVYCEQELFLNCVDASLEIQGSHGWYSVDGQVQNYWAGNMESNPIGCAGGHCNCNSQGQQADGGLLIGLHTLPVSKISIGFSDGQRTLDVGSLKCFEIYKDCNEILINNARYGKRKSFAIDPDGAGGVNHFEVKCDFKTDKKIGITEVIIDNNVDGVVIEGPKPLNFVSTIPIKYSDADADQIHALTTNSWFCYQGMTLECIETPIINWNNPSYSYYTIYNDSVSTSYGTAFQSQVGCPCMITGSCPPGHSCHCDAKSPTKKYEYGYETNRFNFPIKSFHVGGQITDNAHAKYSITNIRCGPTYFDFPTDCEHARQHGFLSGDILIRPNKKVKPMFVYCDMDWIPGMGITIVRHDRMNETDMTQKQLELVTYNGIHVLDLKELVDISNVCYQPVLISCYYTLFLGRGKFDWYGNKMNKGENWGHGEFSECSCALTSQCGGKGSRLKLQDRKCNCDAKDHQWRADGGVLSDKTKLPVVNLRMRGFVSSTSQAKFKLGMLYCAPASFDLDECTLGFHDCHEHATCENTFGKFTCRCNPGYRSLGRPIKDWPNGRNCYDDDECKINKCPWSANCTNTPGSFFCTCKDGFTQIDDVTCEDINECALGFDDCDENALCINRQGNYICVCKVGYEGDGRTCRNVGTCACFGEPHCISIDGKWLHYQGGCQYVMMTDGCNGANASFEVLIQNWEWNYPGIGVTWVKEVTIKIFGYEIQLLQNYGVRINGNSKNLPYRKNGLYYIKEIGNYIRVVTNYGIRIQWDGYQSIEVSIPGSYKTLLCGLCGNYNDDDTDDWLMGPACSNEYGLPAPNGNAFGDSWTDLEYVANNHSECVNCDAPPPENPCSDTAIQSGMYFCGKIFHEDGPFLDCIEIISEDVYVEYFASCIYDLCRVEDQSQTLACNSVEQFIHHCQKNYNIIIDDWDHLNQCINECPEGMTFTSRNKPEDDVCFPDEAGLENDIEQYYDGCFCPEGLVKENGKCISPDECGCIDGNDEYHPTGSSYYTENCDQIITCDAFTGDLLPIDVACDENAYCGTEDGDHGCHCHEGYIGDGLNCDVDPCFNHDCVEKEFCVALTNGSQKCECIDGFAVDCEKCTDIDECAIYENICSIHADCVNTDGSYLCKCRNGTVNMGNGKCDDVDECELSRYGISPSCGNNSRCINTFGSFQCKCCEGYTLTEEGDCVEDSDSIVEGIKCCVCDRGQQCLVKGKICGEDHVTYEDFAELIVVECEKNMTIGVDYKEACQKKCNNLVKCPMYQHCEKDQVSNKATCVCDPCTLDEVKVIVDVCSESLILYKTMCEFKNIMCEYDIEEIIVPIPPEECMTGEGGGAPFTQWSEWYPCSVTCGKGEKTKTRQATRTLTPVEELIDQTATADCYEDVCPDSVCLSVTCDSEGAICVPDDDNQPVCECPSCLGEGLDPVCGIVQNFIGMYNNPCKVHRAGCLNNQPFEVLNEGQCGSVPLNCTVMPKFETVEDDNGCISQRKINVRTCLGYCGIDPDLCCEVDHYETKTVNLRCPDGTLPQTERKVPASCSCRKLTV